MKYNRSRSLKMGPIDRSYSRACVTITSSGVCFVSKQLASTSFRRQVLSTLLVRRWRNLSGNVRLSNLLISSWFCSKHTVLVIVDAHCAKHFLHNLGTGSSLPKTTFRAIINGGLG